MSYHISVPSKRVQQSNPSESGFLMIPGRFIISPSPGGCQYENSFLWGLEVEKWQLEHTVNRRGFCRSTLPRSWTLTRPPSATGSAAWTNRRASISAKCADCSSAPKRSWCRPMKARKNPRRAANTAGKQEPKPKNQSCWLHFSMKQAEMQASNTA